MIKLKRKQNLRHLKAKSSPLISLQFPVNQLINGLGWNLTSESPKHMNMLSQDYSLLKQLDDILVSAEE